MDASVLIVGAGPVGLALAVELDRRGIDTIVIEQLARGGHQPRAKTTNVRSMAHFRRWGLAEQVKRSSPLPDDYPRDIIFATRLFGQEIARFRNAFFGDQRVRDDRFPEAAQWIPQYKIEEVLRSAINGRPKTKLLFGHRLYGLRQDSNGVTATVERDGQETELRTRYLVGADGGRSEVRALIDARMEGDAAYMRNFLAVYRAPGLAEKIPLDPAISYWLVNPDAPAVTGPMDEGDRWFFSSQLKGDAPPYDEPEARELISLAIGADVPFDILETDTWSAHRLLADRYRRERVFLAGDACHLHPPMGGYGMNMGIGDAVDLGWKLAAVLNGWGGEALLDSYETERRTVARLVIDEAAENYSFVTHHMVREAMEGDSAASAAVRAELGASVKAGKAREFLAMNVVLGLRYESPIIVPEHTPPPTWDPMTYELDARPGALAPHHWLEDGTSIYDHFGPDFTLLALDGAPEGEIAALRAAAQNMNFPLTVARRLEPALRPLYGAAMTLVRPDQHVAWRGDRLPGDPSALLARVSGHLAAPVCQDAAS
jgi:2-polyprenyl-6-methoxyphenol hydroxylase-like FAD-dependent oxidoreductase